MAQVGWHALLQHLQCGAPFHFNAKINTKILPLHLHLHLPPPPLQRQRRQCSGSVATATSTSSKSQSWEEALITEGIDPLGYQSPKQKRKHISYDQEEELGEEEEEEEETLPSPDFSWVHRSRHLSVADIRARGFNITVDDLLKTNKKKKKKKKKKQQQQQLKLRLSKSLCNVEEEEDLDDEGATQSAAIQRMLADIGAAELREGHNDMVRDFRDAVRDRAAEVALNRALVAAETGDDVVAAVAAAMRAVEKGLRPSPLSAVNVATALHRLATHAERAALTQSERLALARRAPVATLVCLAVAALGNNNNADGPQPQPRTVANVAWALAKLGAPLLYMSEMEALAVAVAARGAAAFGPQHMANVAGAFAAMQHSAPRLFSALASRAAATASTFKPQELAQFLWAFACLFAPPDPFLDALDSLAVGFDLGRFNHNELGSLGWSYAVLGQLHRPFFARVWEKLRDIDVVATSLQKREDAILVWQMQQVNQCLKLEYPHLDFCVAPELQQRLAQLCQSKRFNSRVTSLFQKQVARLLVSTGYKWEREYLSDGYVVDAVIADRMVALEMDGPTHFARNTGTPLGHTMLKRRLLSAAGWKVVSLSWKDWDTLSGESEQIEFLRRILNDVLEPQENVTV